MSNINQNDSEKLLCHDFEGLLSNYLDGTLDAKNRSRIAKHVLACPICHDLLNEVKTTIAACQISKEFVAPPSADFEARIVNLTMPSATMSCKKFETLLTDYLDGFLPAHLFHRWERHAVLCENCTNLPGSVVRSIGACYTFKADELMVPAGLHERILTATLGTERAKSVKMSFWIKIEHQIKDIFKPVMTPIFTAQFASIAAILLMAIIIFTNAGSADGSISSVYRTGAQLAAQTYEESADAVESGISLGLNLNSSSKPQTRGGDSNERKE